MLVLNISSPTTPADEHRDDQDRERRPRGLGAADRAPRRHHGQAGTLDGGLGEARDPGAGPGLAG